MIIKKNELSKFKKNIFSECGEDGIIEEVFYRLKKAKIALDKRCCEFGAWNGMHASNTYNLIKNQNYEGILIEGDKKKFKELCNNIPDKKIIKINKFVEFLGKNKLDNILKKNNFYKNFDFLSIDIDGNDYHIFEGLEYYKPKLICIEFNPSIPNEVIFIQKKDAKINQGSSALALIELAKKKNYYPVAATDLNLFFIKNSLKKYILKKKNYKINDLINDKNKNYIFFGYDGSIMTSKTVFLTWHGLKVKKINVLPKILNQFPGNYNLLKKMLLILFLFYKDPLKYLQSPKKYSIKLLNRICN
jgi:hypothetical protein